MFTGYSLKASGTIRYCGYTVEVVAREMFDSIAMFIYAITPTESI